MVANTLLSIVRCDPSNEIKYIIESVKDKYGYQISYTKAWRSLKRTVEIVYGTWKSSVQLLPKYIHALCKYNPGTIVDLKHLRNNEEIKTLNYCFWAFKTCTDGFRHYQKIISVDGTHLYTNYKHKMLIVVTLDANNQVLPLAFAIVDEETSDSCKCFLENDGRHVICGENGMCLISDRHKGIVRAVEDLTYFKHLHGEAGKQHQICKFDAIMEAIKNKNILTHRYLAGISKKKWSMAHDEGWRRGVMMKNMFECLNSVLKGARRLPISAIVATGGRPSRGQHMQVVRISTTDCSCGKWTIFGIPCSHDICTAKWHSLDPTTLVQSWYNISEYLAAYEGRFEPLADERYWDRPTF
ncbi:uncharacterized protein [Henckelia pumila]|uniref:uncharacterized protein n=1 Tax=Henckelia pumila TaxID=405737 RepID=UPI003C6E6178